MNDNDTSRIIGIADPGDPSLPVAGRGKLSKVRKSKRAPWRAGVLIGIHVLIAVHATHFLLAGKTLSPVEPSESMYTLELGQVNAGFVFFAVALLATLVFGRFFCGWGCHIVALQDLCGWIMKRLGVRPKPFRTRLLIYAPLILALYMFVWPSLLRLVIKPVAAGLDFGWLNALLGPAQSFPGFSNHLATAGFWDTFPGPVFAVLTALSCGFAAVYLLGAKGFCTYGCPYGGFFGVVDQLAPMRIRVTDACEQCGHCTATCTSNVLVHEEVRRFGAVVDPGCMKCMDCVSVCPKNALYAGWGKPALFKGKPADEKRSRRYPVSLPGEIALALVFLSSTLAFRRLYDGPPLLMSVGLGGMTAFVALKLWQLLRKPTVRVQNLKLKTAGTVGLSGWVFSGIATLWLVFAAHSGLMQWDRYQGAHYLDLTEANREDVINGSFRHRVYTEGHDLAAERSFKHFARADRFGLFGVVEVKLGVAWGHLLNDDLDAAITAVEEAIAIAPDNANLHKQLIELLTARERLPELVEALRNKFEHVDTTAADRFEVAGLLVGLGRPEDAVEHYQACVAEAPNSFEAHYNLGGLLRRLERPDEAIEPLEIACRLAPTDPDPLVELGLALAATGANVAAVAHFARAIELAPDSPEAQYLLPDLIQQLQGLPAQSPTE